MSIKKNNIDAISFIMELMTQIYVVAMIGIFPLFYLDDYINILQAKATFFKVITIPFLSVGFCFCILHFIIKKFVKKTDIDYKISVTDICAVVFAVVVVISCAMSPAGKEAFLGELGRYVGGWILLLCIGIYFIISRYFQMFQGFIWVFLIANVAQWMLVILQFWRIDPLNMQLRLTEHQRILFLGTIGNVNFISGYTGIVLAILMAFYCQSEGRLSKICYGSGIGIGFYAAYVTQTQSWVLGILTAAVILVWFTALSKDKLRKTAEIWGIFFVMSLLIKAMMGIAKITGYHDQRFTKFGVDRLMTFVLSWRVLLFHLIGISLWLLFIYKYKEAYGRALRKLMVILLLIVAVALMIYVFPLEDSFGSGRGYIWKTAILEFKKLPLLQKLFGYGPNCFYQFMEQNHGKEMVATLGSYVIDAHNEFLQFLVVTGIFGVVSYFGIQISVLVHGIKNLNKNPVLLAGIAGLGVYVVQGLISNSQIFITPLLFVFLGIMERSNRKGSIS